MSRGIGLLQNTFNWLERSRHPLAERDYMPQIEAAREAAFGSVPEVAARYSVILLAVCALLFIDGQLIHPMVAIAYLATNLLGWRVMSLIRGPAGLRTYLGVAALRGLSSGMFAFMPAHVWITTEDPVLKLFAACGLIAYAMFVLAFYKTRTLITVIETGIVLCGVMAIWIFELTRTASIVDQFAMTIAIGGVTAYYMAAQTSIIRDRAALDQSREAALQSQKMDVIGQLTAGIAHDFNNVLTAIQGNIELAEVTHDPHERRRVLAEAHDSTRRAADVVAQMMAYVRKSPLAIREVDLARFIDRFDGSLARQFPPSIQRETRLWVDGLVMRVDEALLETALLNLALNAREAMEDRDGTLRLDVTRTDGADWPGEPPRGRPPYAELKIRDNGPGIAVQHFDHVTEPFFTTKRRANGPGLGLSMVEGFAEQSGGSMYLRNHPDGGLEVSLLLPCNGPPSGGGEP